MGATLFLKAGRNTQVRPKTFRATWLDEDEPRRKRQNAMPFIPTPECLELMPVFSLNNATWSNVLHLSVENPENGFTHEACREAYIEWFSDNMVNLISDQCALQRIVTRDVSQDDGTIFDYSLPVALEGTRASPAMPSNIAVCVTKRSSFAGRSRRGRIYYAGITEDWMVGNILSAGLVEDLLDAHTAMFAAWAVAEAGLVIRSLYTGNVARTEGVKTPVISFSVDQRVDTQRKRLNSTIIA